jgi:hypothetical protein
VSCHPLATQLRSARSKFVRCLNGVSAKDAIRCIMPMNSINWVRLMRQMLGHKDLLGLEQASDCWGGSQALTSLRAASSRGGSGQGGR